jgi:glycosyltransferase involved in cell wall biosynthesis
VRVKLLEAFAAGMPVVSTYVGAEGLASMDGEICGLADDPERFAERVLGAMEEPGKAAEMARRAREFVRENRDMRTMTGRLVECYQSEVKKARGI